ncbi:MAG: hypothetical protein LBI16_05715, partial [Burkholderiales bacterium]|nr:hypothetical protein [Burkholderiales bacterium]
MTFSFVQAADIQHIYDPAGRLIQTTAPNGASIYYTYDSVGNITATKQYATNSPTIFGFTPASGMVGTVVTINGSGFNPTITGNVVSFNGAAATVLTASTAVLKAAVPVGATSGPISVSNANGTAVSTTPFIVGNEQIPDGTPKPISLAANASTSFTFMGDQGQGYALGLTGVVGNLTVTVTKPDGANLVTCSSITATTSCVFPYLPVAGVYTVLLKAGNSATSLSVSLNADVGGTLTNNVPNTFVVDKVGLVGTYTFSAIEGALGRLSITEDTIPGNSTIQLYRPNGTLHQSKIVSASAGNEGAAILDFTNLPATGTYKVRLLPPAGNATGRMVVRLIQDVVDISTVGGSAQGVLLLPNQNGHFSFEGIAGEWLGVGFTNLSVTPSNGSVSVVVYKPDGISLTNCSINGTAGGCALPKLPVTGTYKILINPGSNAASFDLLLTEDAAGVLEANGPAQTFAPARVGQAAGYTFSGTAGQSANLQIAGDTFVGYTYLYVYKPDGAQLTYTYAYYSSGAGTSAILTLNNLPTTGVYTARLVPPSGKLGSINVALRVEETGALPLGGTGTTVNLLAAQNATYTFTGTVGQWLGVGFANLSVMPSNGSVSVTVYKPDGTSLTNCSINGTASGCVLPKLPVTGTYKILINPGNNTASFKLLLTADATGVLASNGIQTFTPSRVGQAASYTFSVTAGQTVGLSMSGSTFTGYTYAYIYKPDGSQLTNTYAYSNGSSGGTGQVTLTNLAVAGTYTVRVIPPSGQLGTVV